MTRFFASEALKEGGKLLQFYEILLLKRGKMMRPYYWAVMILQKNTNTNLTQPHHGVEKSFRFCRGIRF